METQLIRVMNGAKSSKQLGAGARVALTALFFFLLCSVAAAAPAGSAGVAKSAQSQKQTLPQTLADSLPWFAIREIADNNPPFTRTHLSLMAAKSDRVALVYFATWCIPCRVGVKKLAENSAELQKHNVQVVLVNVGERDESMIQKWVGKTGATMFKLVGDPFKRTTEGFGLVGENQEISLPRTIVLDKNIKPLFMLGEEGSDWPEVLWK